MQDLIRPDASFTPRELFARMQGAWLEPRQGSMWQAQSGVVTTAATTSGGQTIGLMLDQSRQAQLGSELAAAINNASAWTPYGSNTVTEAVPGEITITYAGGAAFGAYVFTASLGLSVGGVYQFSCEAAINTGSATVYINDGFLDVAFPPTTSTSFTTYTTVFTYIAGGVIQLKNLSDGEALTLRNISIRQILGNHASQTTAANRPTLQYNGNLPLIRHADSTDVLAAAMPDLGGGVFSSAGSVYFATPGGMSCLHNQSIGTSYNLPALQTDIYGTVITPARLAPPLEQRLALYMHRLAGLSDADFFWQEDYGPELVTNGDFSNGIAGWTISGPFTATDNGNGTVTFTGAANNAGFNSIAFQFVPVTVGKTYKLIYTEISDAANCGVGVYMSGHTGDNVFVANATGIYTFVATSAMACLHLFCFDQWANIGFTISQCTCRELKDGMVGQLTDDAGELLLRA